MNYVKQIIKIFASSTFNSKDVKEVHEWLIHPDHAEEKQQALSELWKECQPVQVDLEASIEKTYKKIFSSRYPQSIPQKRFTWLYYAAAITVIFISGMVGTYFFTKNTYQAAAITEVSTELGERHQLILPDGTTVQLNADTRLIFPEKFTDSIRKVYLFGEANFKVKKDPEKPFIVSAHSMDITALGTEFNVSAYPEDKEIIATLLEGKIKVDCKKNSESYLLSPGEEIAYSRYSQKSTLRKADLTYTTAWQEGIQVFQGKTMPEILSALTRKYHIKFIYNESLFNDDKYQFRFSEKAEIEEVLSVMQKITKQFQYQIKHDTCYIR